MLSDFISSQIYAKFVFQPTFGQKKLIETLSEYATSDPDGSILVLNGYAGTGKTSLISVFVDVLKDMNVSVVLLAPTGRAAKVFASYAGIEAYTVHKKIYRQKSLTVENSPFDLAPNRHKDTFFIVDEASMLSVDARDSMFGSGSLLEDLVRYVRSGAGCRLILLGDNAQLPPVGLDESPALDLEFMDRYGAVIPVTLDEVVRQKQDSGILFNATLVRCMLDASIIDIPMFRTEFPDIFPIEGGDLNETLQDAYARYGAENTLIITRSNRRANKYNEGVRRFALFREEEISSGDLLMVVKNNYHYKFGDENEPTDFIANGDIVRLRRIRRYEELYGFRFADVTLVFPDYNNYELDCKIILDTLSAESPSLSQEQMRSLFYAVEQDYADITVKRKRYEKIREDPYFNALQVKFAYAVTCHKAQGGQWSCVFVDRMLFGDESITRDLLRWLYTALTRSTERLYLVNFDERFFE